MLGTVEGMKRFVQMHESPVHGLNFCIGTLGEMLEDDAGRQQLNDIYDSLNVVHRLHEGELAKALGIQLGFNANDGD